MASRGIFLRWCRKKIRVAGALNTGDPVVSARIASAGVASARVALLELPLLDLPLLELPLLDMPLVCLVLFSFSVDNSLWNET